MPLLEVESLWVGAGPTAALRGVDLTVEEAEVVAVTGHGGSGKTVLLRTLAGLVRPAAGRIRFEGRPITHEAAERRAGRGIAMVPAPGRLRGRPPGELARGRRQVLAIRRALSTDPLLLLIDDPGLGLSPEEWETVAALIRDLAAAGMAMVVAGQQPPLLALAARAVVLEEGAVAARGGGAELWARSDIRIAHLGAPI